MSRLRTIEKSSPDSSVEREDRVEEVKGCHVCCVTNSDGYGSLANKSPRNRPSSISAGVKLGEKMPNAKV